MKTNNNYGVGLKITAGTGIVVGILCGTLIKCRRAKHEAEIEKAKIEAEKAKYEAETNKSTAKKNK